MGILQDILLEYENRIRQGNRTTQDRNSNFVHHTNASDSISSLNELRQSPITTCNSQNDFTQSHSFGLQSDNQWLLPDDIDEMQEDFVFDMSEILHGPISTSKEESPLPLPPTIHCPPNTDLSVHDYPFGYNFADESQLSAACPQTPATSATTTGTTTFNIDQDAIPLTKQLCPSTANLGIHDFSFGSHGAKSQLLAGEAFSINPQNPGTTAEGTSNFEGSLLPPAKHYCSQRPSTTNLCIHDISFGTNFTESGSPAGEVFPSPISSDFSDLQILDNSTMDWWPSKKKKKVMDVDDLTGIDFGGSFSQISDDNILDKSSENIFMSDDINGQPVLRDDRPPWPSCSRKKETRSLVKKVPYNSQEEQIKYKGAVHYKIAEAPPPKKNEKEKVKRQPVAEKIATLRDMIVPFDRPITDSVLSATIAEINLLHAQLKTLIAPLMNSSNDEELPTIVHGGSSKEDENHGLKSLLLFLQGSSKEGENHALKSNLKNKGLCLVPRSHASNFIENVQYWQHNNV